MIETRLLSITGALFVGSFVFAMLGGTDTFVSLWFAIMSLALGMGSLATGIATTSIILTKESRN